MVEARPFLEAVDANEVLDYYDVIKVPAPCLPPAGSLAMEDLLVVLACFPCYLGATPSPVCLVEAGIPAPLLRCGRQRLHQGKVFESSCMQLYVALPCMQRWNMSNIVPFFNSVVKT